MLPKSLNRLIDSLAKLPGIGRKSAERLAYFLVRSHRSIGKEIGESLLNLEHEVMLCRECFFLSDGPVCAVCVNPRRDRSIICVVEHIFDADAIERSGEFRGVYHILHGRIAPLDNITPDDLKIKELIARVKRMGVPHEAHAAFAGSERRLSLEIILATNPSAEGEQTAIYLQKVLSPLGVKITRIATGIPVGADLEYADEVTLARALKGRQQYDV